MTLENFIGNLPASSRTRIKASDYISNLLSDHQVSGVQGKVVLQSGKEAGYGEPSRFGWPYKWREIKYSQEKVAEDGSVTTSTVSVTNSLPSDKWFRIFAPRIRTNISVIQQTRSSEGTLRASSREVNTRRAVKQATDIAFNKTFIPTHAPQAA